ncbi:MAG: imidazole glycerol phosphate synthase subunit HisH [Verrucomicrobiota bacterium]
MDYGAGNLHSVEKALRYLGAEVRRVTRPAEVDGINAMVLPGVGAFDDCIHALQRQELVEAVRRFISTGKPFLGICVGYQALFERSDEFNSCAMGLGLFQGRVVRFSGAGGLKVPQIGWNQLSLPRADCPLFRDIPNGSYAYFVHSFYPKPIDRSIVAAETEYGETFASAIWQENVYATQFHPEKSQKVGLQILQNFIGLS